MGVRGRSPRENFSKNVLLGRILNHQKVTGTKGCIRLIIKMSYLSAMLMINQKTGHPNLLTLLKIHMISSYGLNIIQKHIIPQRKIGAETPPSKDIPLGLKKGFLGYVLRGGYCRITSISESNRDDRTTSHSFFIAQNVRPG